MRHPLFPSERLGPDPPFVQWEPSGLSNAHVEECVPFFANRWSRGKGSKLTQDFANFWCGSIEVFFGVINCEAGYFALASNNGTN